MKKALLALPFALLTSTASAGTISIDAFDNGIYTSNGFHRPTATFLNETNSSAQFFAFDLSSVTQDIVSASMEILAGNGEYRLTGAQTSTRSFFTGATSVVYRLLDVVTPINTIRNGTAGVAGYNDLASGAVLGSTTFGGTFTPINSGRAAMPSVRVGLNSAGLQSINAARGGSLLFGGNSSITSSSNSGHGLWFLSNGVPAARLTLTFADPPPPPPPPPPPATVPAPLSALLGLTGLLSLGALRRMRPKHQKPGTR